MPRRKNQGKNRRPKARGSSRAKNQKKQKVASSNNQDGKNPANIKNGIETEQITCQHHALRKNEVHCDGHHSGLLTKDEIEKYGIIKNPVHDCLQITSYDLRLGEGHMVYDSTVRSWSAKWVSNVNPPENGNPPYAREGVDLIIPPFGMALIQLRETVDLLTCIKNTNQPVMVCGHFDLKLSRVKEGLISQQATQVEPGYRGKLFCYLFNQTGDEISISYTDETNWKVATIEFQYASCLFQCDVNIRQDFLSSLNQMHEKYSGTYCYQHGIKDVRFFQGATGEMGKLPKHGGLSSITQRLENAQELAQKGCEQAIKAAGRSKTFAWSWVVGLVATVISMFLFILSEKNEQRVTEISEHIISNREEMTTINNEVKAARDSLAKLQKEAQETYDKAKTAIDEIEKEKKSLSQKNISNSDEKPDLSNKQKGEGGDQ